MQKQLPSVSSILKEIKYDAKTGEAVYLKSNKKLTTKLKHGYISVQIGKKRYNLHRLVWKIMTGQDPKGVIDHINNNRQDNRFVNLRDVSKSQNSRNRSINKNHKYKLKGARFSKDKNKWFTTIDVNCKTIWLGFHETAEEAHKAYCEAAKTYFGEFANTGK